MSLEDLSAIVEIAARQGVPIHIHVHLENSKIEAGKDNSSSDSKVPSLVAGQAIGLEAEVLQVLSAGPLKKEAIIRQTAQGKGLSHGRAVTRALDNLWHAKRVVRIRHGWWSLAA